MAPNEPEVIDAEPSAAELARGLRLISNAMVRKQMKENEVALKGLYVNWAFDKLNLTKYR